MHIRNWVTGLLLVFSSAIAGAQALDDAAIRKQITRIVDVQKKGVAIVVGIVDKNGPRVIAYGALDQGDPRPLDGDTVFEIGSITKTFTSLLLADMVRRKEAALDDPISKYLPEGVKAPERGGRQITLIDLATHTSGLPRMPGNFKPADRANPYADYTAQRMYAFLSHYELKRDIGSRFEYSNYGVGLLGQLLARRAGKDYETLLKERVLGPLNMTSTAITLSPDMKSRLALGHRGDLSDTANWDLGVFAGAGGIRSTASDLLKYLAANLGLVKSPLGEAMVDMRKVRRPAGSPNAQVALSWIVPNAGNGQVFMHNGGTGGYRSDLGFDLEKGVGIVVLTNAANNVADPLGRRLLGLRTPPSPPRESDAPSGG